MLNDSTICAIATSPGKGAVAVIRLSGKDAVKICNKVFVSVTKGKKLTKQAANTLHYGTLKDGKTIIDDVIISIFRSPNSYTGEDVIEISCHGSTYIQQQIMQVLIKNGARPAGPGEFTLRAFLNNKLDLSQSEAVADLIASTSKAAHRVAMQQMRGGFSDEISILRNQLLELVSLIELELDFAEEDVEFADRKKLDDLIKKIQQHIQELIKSYNLGNVIKRGIPVAITGRPNVGKSTLLNVLLEEERAIVSEIPGTTRDIIEDTIVIEGVEFRFIDTAGLRKGSKDKIEAVGIKKTWEKIGQAAVVIQVVEATDTVQEIDEQVSEIKKRLKGQEHIVVMNKIDLAKGQKIKGAGEWIPVSAKDKKNIDKLLEALLKVSDLAKLDSTDTIVTNARHYEALVRSAEAIERVVSGMENSIATDLLAQDIREALHYLGEITGEITTDEILGNIFKKFCIGK